ncbi:MAG TPA: hypothetical protein VNQ90_18185 [Chthoniobacteraceae bacterium]|nr:hypothetical protein [Chthoniobacteraceae bacterium]
MNQKQLLSTAAIAGCLLWLLLAMGHAATPGERNIREFSEKPEEVTDWGPLITEAMAAIGEGGTLHFPGPGTYPVGQPLVVEHGVVFRFEPGVTLEGGEIPALFILKKGKRMVFEGLDASVTLSVKGEKGIVFDLRNLSPETVPDVVLRRLHLVGYRGLDATNPPGVHYTGEQGMLGELLIDQCHVEASDLGIAHQQGTIRSLRVSESLFSGNPRMGLFVTCPILEGAYVSGNRFLDIGIRAVQLGGGKANMIDDGAVEHISAATVHDNQVLGGGHRAEETTAYAVGILVYGNNVSIQGNIVRDFNRGEPVPGERIGHHFKMKDGSYHRGPWVYEDGKPRRRLAGAAIYAKARNGIIANNVCTNSGWRAVIEVKTGGREPYFLVANNVVDGRSLAIDESFGFEPNVAKALWVNNVVYNMPHRAFRVTNRMESAYMNNVIYDSKIGFEIDPVARPNPELIANNHFVNVEKPIVFLDEKKFTAAVTPPFPIQVPNAAALPGFDATGRGRLAMVTGSNRMMLAAYREGEALWSDLGAGGGGAASWKSVGPDLVNNPALERDDSTADRAGAPRAWRFGTAPEGISAAEVIAYDGEPGPSGSPALRIGGEGAPPANWILQQPLSLQPGTSYRAKAIIKRQSPETAVTLILDDGGKVGESAKAAKVGEWETLSVVFTLPEGKGAESPRVRLHGSQGGAGRGVAVDSIHVEEVRPVQETVSDHG